MISVETRCLECGGALNPKPNIPEVCPKCGESLCPLVACSVGHLIRHRVAEGRTKLEAQREAAELVAACALRALREKPSPQGALIAEALDHAAELHIPPHVMATATMRSLRDGGPAGVRLLPYLKRHRG